MTNELTTQQEVVHLLFPHLLRLFSLRLYRIVLFSAQYQHHLPRHRRDRHLHLAIPQDVPLPVADSVQPIRFDAYSIPVRARIHQESRFLIQGRVPRILIHHIPTLIPIPEPILIQV